MLEEFLRNEMVQTYQDLEYFKSNPVNAFYINDELAEFDRMVFERTLARDRSDLWKMINRTDSSRVVAPSDLMVFEKLELLDYFGRDVRSEKTSTYWTLIVQADQEKVDTASS